MIANFNPKHVLKNAAKSLLSTSKSLFIVLAAVTLAGSSALPVSSHAPPPPKTVNVLNYGADKTGTKDSLKAFQSAAKAAGTRGVLLVPPGTYLLSAEFDLLNGQSIKGAGPTSVLRGAHPTASGSILTMSGTGGLISNLAFSAPTYGSGSALSYQNGVLIKSITTTFTVSQVTFSSTLSTALTVNNVTGGGTVENCVFNSASAACIWFSGVKNFNVENNVFNQGGNSLFGFYPQSTNLAIRSNTFQFPAGANDSCAINIGGVTNCQITNNKVTVPSNAWFDGFLRLNGSDAALGWGPVSNVQVTGNQCTNCAPLGTGAIYVGAAAVTPAANLVSGVTIANNTVSQNPLQALGWPTSDSSGITIMSAMTGLPANAINGITVSGNTLTGTAIYGVYANYASGVQILQNSVTNCAGTCIDIGPNCGGSVAITSNKLSNSGWDSASDAKNFKISTNAVMQAEAVPAGQTTSIKSIAFENNKYTGNKNNLNYNIYCAVSRSKAKVTDSGNTNEALLPDYLAA